MSVPRVLALVLLAASLGACLGPEPLVMPELARARVAADFHTYELHRVGILPFTGRGIDAERARELQLAFLAELAQATPYELVLLDGPDVQEIEASDPFRRGVYRPRTIIQTSRRYNLDALLFGTVTEERFFAPQVLALAVDLVAAETGLVIWSSSVHLDASDPRVVDGLELYFGDPRRADETGGDWRISLLSPERFARFAAFQVACLL